MKEKKKLKKAIVKHVKEEMGEAKSSLKNDKELLKKATKAIQK